MSAGGQIVSEREKIKKKFRKIRATHHSIQKILIRRFTPLLILRGLKPNELQVSWKLILEPATYKSYFGNVSEIWTKNSERSSKRNPRQSTADLVCEMNQSSWESHGGQEHAYLTWKAHSTYRAPDPSA